MSMHSLEEQIRGRFQSGSPRLPVLPEAVIEVRRMMNDDSKGAADIARALGRDPALSSAVLRVANSARFRAGGAEIRNLAMAVQRLGGRRTLDLLVAISSKVHMAVKDRRMQALVRKANDYSLQVAVTAQHVATVLRMPDPAEAFLAGMLFDIGAPAIVSAAGDLLVDHTDAECDELIRALHHEMGGRLLALWEMPDIFAAVATYHGVEADDRPHEALIDMVDAARIVLADMGRNAPFDAGYDGPVAQQPPIRRLGLSATHLAAVEVELESDVEELRAALGA